MTSTGIVPVNNLVPRVVLGRLQEHHSADVETGTFTEFIRWAIRCLVFATACNGVLYQLIPPQSLHGPSSDHSNGLLDKHQLVDLAKAAQKSAQPRNQAAGPRSCQNSTLKCAIMADHCVSHRPGHIVRWGWCSSSRCQGR